MTSRDFCFWVQGFAEVHGGPPNAEQWETIKKHLNLVFVHEIDPSMPDPTGKLQEAHDGPAKVKPPETVSEFIQSRPRPGPMIRC